MNRSSLLGARPRASFPVSRLGLGVSALALAVACGGAAAVDPIGAPADGGAAAAIEAGTSPDPGVTPTPATPTMPTGPYTGLVGTTDVSILYPLPAGATADDFVGPTATGAHGELLPKAVFDTVLEGRSLERVTFEPPSGHGALRLVSVRLDPCSARGGSGCRSEVRAVFQALYQKAAGLEDDPSAGIAATDGGVHVIYDVPDAELVTMLKQILTLKKANGDLALHELAPHPILAAQGLGGGFATGLRGILLEHIGDARIGRVTFFDHNFDPDGDGWLFGVMDRVGGSMAPGRIPGVVGGFKLMVMGSGTRSPLAASSAEAGSAGGRFNPGADSVLELVSPGRPAPGPQSSTLQPAYEAALRVQNPTLHTAESIDCANCHLAEGAARLGETEYGRLSPTKFGHPRSLAYVTAATSVTNLHAFGYLHRKVAIMQRTANESAVVAAALEPRVK